MEDIEANTGISRNPYSIRFGWLEVAELIK